MAARAETLLWRLRPPAWQLEIEAGPRFLAAVDEALRTLPGDVAAEFARASVPRTTSPRRRRAAGRRSGRAAVSPSDVPAHGNPVSLGQGFPKNPALPCPGATLAPLANPAGLVYAPA